MVYKGDLDIDPRGMIYEAYRIEGLVIEEARAIFLDWALGEAKVDMSADLKLLLKTYGEGNADHPMTQVITEGLQAAPKAGRRGGRMGRAAARKV